MTCFVLDMLMFWKTQVKAWALLPPPPCQSQYVALLSHMHQELCQHYQLQGILTVQEHDVTAAFGRCETVFDMTQAWIALSPSDVIQQHPAQHAMTHRGRASLAAAEVLLCSS